jgi:D-amino-acid dehydrogenase
VVVVGAGVVGVCAAMQLQREGARVTVLDRQAPGEGASYGNMSIIGEDSVVPIATPGVLKQLPRMLMDPLSPLAIRWPYVPQLLPWLWRFLKAARPAEVERISKALADLLDGAIDAFKPLLEEAGEPDMLRRTGWLCVYETERGFRAYRHSLELQRRRGVRVDVLGGGELRQLEPALGDTDRFHKGVYYPDVCYAGDNYKLVRVLARAFRQRGGRILREEVSDFEIGPEGPSAAVTQKGRHTFDRLVIAAGAWSRPLIRRLGCDVPLETERGYQLTLNDPETRPRTPVFSTERGMVCTPIDAGLRIGGTVELGGLEAPPDWRRADVLLRNAQRWFPDLTDRDSSRWMGHRPSMPDSMPVISRAPDFHNTVFAFGHGHCGLMLSARTGEMVRDLVLDRDPSVDPAPFRADRF